MGVLVSGVVAAAAAAGGGGSGSLFFVFVLDEDDQNYVREYVSPSALASFHCCWSKEEKEMKITMKEAVQHVKT